MYVSDMRRYIFNSEGGQDRSGKSEKISMTSPVKAEMLDGGYKVRWRSDCDQQTGGLSCSWRLEAVHNAHLSASFIVWLRVRTGCRGHQVSKTM